MTPRTEPLEVAGPAGVLQAAIDRPQTPGLPSRGIALSCHPHPLFGGTMDNKVVVTLGRAFVQLGWTSVRFNYRGVGRSAGAWDEGRGEVDDALAVIRAVRRAGEPLLIAGFSFGGYVASRAAEALAETERAERLVLIAPAAKNFAVAPVPPDTLVVQGEADDVVPMSAVLDWARPQALPITVVPGAGHFFHGQLTLLKQIVLAALGPVPGGGDHADPDR